MRLFDSDTAEFKPEFGALASRWETHGDLGEPPFGVMWCRIDPASATVQDRHPERELITVTSGAGTVRTASGQIDVEVGQTVLVASDEAHVITNRSDTDPLIVLSVYWMPDEQDAR
jgi:mannose-6-phosphate isomerase-like protein (cupin superfamily)